MDAENRLCLLLFGQTEVRRRLAMSVHEALNQRMVVRYHALVLERYRRRPGTLDKHARLPRAPRDAAHVARLPAGDQQPLELRAQPFAFRSHQDLKCRLR